ncbi:MAG: 4'-phosphopantetheinyl transferase superfamily protein [Prevotellaceae bacterium]|jgi:4'-phosphopantetheinyl transferase EntD|nr:4'-phosphopantetheinyl transferase superfamily protein [Prevotellaceae bacterium]
MPLVNIEYQPEGSRIAIWEITETEEMLMQCISEHDRVLEDLVSTAHPQRRLERLAVRALLKNVLNKQDVHLQHYDNGRPYLANSTTNISISHTKHFAAIIYNEKAPVGCDIECYTRDFSAVEQKALSDEERKYLSDKCHNLQLCLLWCAKEAIYKCVKEDSVDFARQIFVKKFIPKEKGKLSALYTNSIGFATEFILRYKMIENYLMVWTVNIN